MTDTQSATPESQTTIDDARVLSRRSFIAVLKANRDVFSNLPERIEQWLEKETRATNQPGTTEHGRDESDRLARPDMEKQLECLQTEINANTQSLMTLDQTVREMTAAFEAMKSEHSSMVFTRDRCVERELKEKEDTIEANKEQLKLVEEENLKLKEELKIKEKEAKDKIKEREERIARLESEQEKKERQIIEIAREEREKAEGLTNEHQKEVDKLLREIQTLKGKNDTLIKEKEEEITKYTQMNLKLKEELKKKEKEAKDKITKQEERIARLESEQEKKERQITEIARQEREKAEGLTNEHQKEVDKLLREIQTLKGKLLKKSDDIQKMYEDHNKNLADHKSRNDTLIKEKEEEITKYTQMQKELTEKYKALLESKDEELKEMKIRHALLSEKPVKRDQRKAEGTLSANRPSEVERDFAEFFDNERMDAMEMMHNSHGSAESIDIYISYPRLACMIFEAAYEQTTEAKDSALHVFKEIINNMIEQAPELVENYWFAVKNNQLPCRVSFKLSKCDLELKYPTDVLDALALSLRETAHLCSLESLKVGVLRKIKDKWLSWLNSEKSCMFPFSDRLLSHLKNYIEACLRLTWRMVTQVPPMQLEYKCTTLKNFHRKVGYHSSPEMCSRRRTADEEEIACYLWPALLDGGGRVIRPAEVLCKVEAD